MGTLNFWKQAAERSAKSAAQALLLLWFGDGVFNLFAVDPKEAAGIAAGAAVLSALTSIVSSKPGEPGDPSLVPRSSDAPHSGRAA